jgi:hypothetical protein
MNHFDNASFIKPAHSRFMVLLTLCLLFTFAACKSSKDVVKKVSTKEVQKMEQFMIQNAPFQTFESKVEYKINARKGVDAGMKGTLKMRRDSCMIFSVQPFAGFEAVKCIIRKDSIVIVSRIHRVYSVEHLPDTEWKEFVNVQTLQAIFCDRMFVPGDVRPDNRKLARFETREGKEGPTYRWAEDAFILDFMFSKDNLLYRLQGNRPEQNQNVLVNYFGFEQESIGVFPHQVELSTEGLPQNLKMQIIYLKPIFDGKTDFSFDIPAKYKKVTTKELIKRFQDML